MVTQQSNRYRLLPSPPGEDPKALVQWAFREFQRIASTLEGVYDFEKFSIAPEKPQDGMVRYADGTYWNPDLTNGEGFYGYWAAAWHFFGGTGGSVTYGNASGLANSNVNGIAASVSRSDHQHKRDVRVAKAGTDVGTRNRLNLIEGSNVTLTVSDDSGSDEIDITIAAGASMTFGAVSGLANANANGSGTDAARNDHQHKRDVRVAKAGTDVGTRNRLNFIEGSNVTLTVADDSGNDEVDITVAAASVVGKQSIWIPASAMITRTTLGANVAVTQTSNFVMLATLNFDPGQDEYAQFTVRMPKSWNESTVIARFVWSHAATTTNFGVVWGLQGTAFSNDDALNTAFSGGATVLDTGGTTDDVYISDETSAITIAGTPAEGDFVVFQVYRDFDGTGDDLAVDARLHGVLLTYTTNAGTDD